MRPIHWPHFYAQNWRIECCSSAAKDPFNEDQVAQARLELPGSIPPHGYQFARLDSHSPRNEVPCRCDRSYEDLGWIYQLLHLMPSWFPPAWVGETGPRSRSLRKGRNIQSSFPWSEGHICWSLVSIFFYDAGVEWNLSPQPHQSLIQPQMGCQAGLRIPLDWASSRK